MKSATAPSSHAMLRPRVPLRSPPRAAVASRTAFGMNAVDDRAQTLDEALRCKRFGVRAQRAGVVTRRIEVAQGPRQRFRRRIVEEFAGRSLDDGFQRSARTIRDR